MLFYRAATSLAPVFLFADAASFDRTRASGVCVAVGVFLFALWEYFKQSARCADPERYFERGDAKVFAFLKRQAFRRRQLAILAGLTSAFMFIGLFSVRPLYWALSWLGALFFAVWTIALACVDAVSIRLRFEDELSRNNSEKILLKYQLDKLREKTLAENERAKEENGAETRDEKIDKKDNIEDRASEDANGDPEK